MRVLINVLAEWKDNKMVKGHVLAAKNLRVCKCHVPKNTSTIIENVPVESSDSYHLCEQSRKRLSYDLTSLEIWNSGRPTTY